MTNSEAKYLLEKLVDDRYELYMLGSTMDEAMKGAIFALEENTKLKAEIEQLKSEFETYYKLYLASIDARQILTEYVEQLKEEVLANKNWSDVVERTLKKEIDKNEMLKSELEQSEITRNKQIDVLLQEIEQLKWKLSSVETQRDLKEYNSKRNADIMSNQLKIIERLKSELEQSEEQFVLKASDNTDYVLAYADGMYCLTDYSGSVVCEFLKGEV